MVLFRVRINYYTVLFVAFSLSAIFLYITLSASAASLTITSPNGGECYTPGSPITISWTSSTDIHDVALGYQPMETSGSQTIPPAWNTLSNPETTWNIGHGITGNSYSWNVPTTISTSTGFYLLIEAHGAAHERIVLDSSNSLFGFSTSCSTSTTGTIPPAPSALSATTPSEGRVTLNWIDNATNEQDYKLYRRSTTLMVWDLIATVSPNTTTHTELSVPLGTYEYQVWACSSGGCSGSNIITITISATPTPTPTNSEGTSSGSTSSSTDTTAPVINFIRVENIMGTGAQIKWTTDNASDSRVYYGTTSGNLTQSAITDCFTSNLTTNHCVNLTNLTLGTRYYYRAESKNATSLSATSTEGSFVAESTPSTVTVSPTPTPTSTSTSTSMPTPTPTLAPIIFNTAIAGTIVDSSGTILTNLPGYVSLSTMSNLATTSTSETSFSTYRSYGSPVEQGKFSIKAPAGSYYLYAYFAPDSPYAAPESIPVTLNEDTTIPISLTVLTPSTRIHGSIKDISGVSVPGLTPTNIKIYASSHTGAWYNATLSPSGDSYEIQIPEGTWNIGYWVDSSTGHVVSSQNIQVITKPETPTTYNIVLRKAENTITGIVQTEDGKLLSNVWISVSTRSFKTTESTGNIWQTSPHIANVSTDVRGKFSVTVPTGTYYLNASSGEATGYLHPEESIVSIGRGETKSILFTFRKPDLVIQGKTTIGTQGTPAFIWAWGEQGGYVTTRSSSLGFFSLSLSKNTVWHVAASRENEGRFFRASEVEINTRALTPPPVNLTLVPQEVFAKAIEHTIETTKPQNVELSDGARVTVPANSLGTSGTANISVRPTIEVPSVASASVVGTSYEVEAKTATGSEITSLNTEITITIPYNDAELASRGLTPETLVLSYFDENIKAWKPVEKQVVDTTKKVVIGTVNHLTVFALIAPADTVPPPAPTNMSIARQGATITLSWKNPSVDFNHVKIYRSQTPGSLGSVVYNYLTGTTQLDTAIGTAAYYTIRAVDLSGNESRNTTQIKSPSSNTTQITTNTATRTLRRGSKGSDVAILQSFLIMTNYLQDKADGIFGPKTWNAVRNFQRTQNLAVDGIAGPKTHARIRALALLGNYSQTP